MSSSSSSHSSASFLITSTFCLEGETRSVLRSWFESGLDLGELLDLMIFRAYRIYFTWSCQSCLTTASFSLSLTETVSVEIQVYLDYDWLIEVVCLVTGELVPSRVLISWWSSKDLIVKNPSEQSPQRYNCGPILSAWIRINAKTWLEIYCYWNDFY